MKFKTRFENLLAKIAKDEDAVEISPKTKVESVLKEIAENGGSGGGGGATIIDVIGPGSDADFHIDATWQELYDRMADGEVMYIKWPNTSSYGGQTANSIHMIDATLPGGPFNGYSVSAGDMGFSTNSPDGNPTIYYD